MMRATRSVLGSPMTVFLVALPFGVLAGWLNHLILGHYGTGQTREEDLMPMVGAFIGVYVSVEIFLGPLLAAISIYVARAHTHGAPAPLSKAINFALNRYRRMFKWHAIAWLMIHFGLALICLPGLFFLAIYAFVDSILCLEKEPWPLARSKKLTRGRRKTIFLVFVPWLLLSQVAQFIELFGYIQKWVLATGVDPKDLRVIEMSNLLGFYGLNTILYIALMWTYMCFYMVYEDRTTPKAKPATS